MTHDHFQRSCMEEVQLSATRDRCVQCRVQKKMRLLTETRELHENDRDLIFMSSSFFFDP